MKEGEAQDAAEKLLIQAQKARRAEQFEDAKLHLQKAITLCQNKGLRFTLAQTLAMLGQIERDQQKPDAALSHYEDALKIFREIAATDRVAHTIRHIADIHRSSGRLELAETCYKETLEIYRHNEPTKPLNLANAIRGFAILKEEMKALKQANSLWQEARQLYESANVSEGVAECNQRIADLDSLPN